MNEGSFLFAEKDNSYFIRLVGDIKYTVCSGFDKFIDDIFNKANPVDVLIDLTETSYIDSTNLGLLAKIAKLMDARHKRKVTIISTNDDINTILVSVGFDEVFDIMDTLEEFAQTLEEIPNDIQIDESSAMMILEAHRNLLELNEKNRDAFKNVVEAMEAGMDEKKQD